MDIDHYQYRKKLLEILRSIAKASFVTFDLEMSGISTRPKPGDRTYDVGKATLQQQYDEIKSAAETFQILQMGLTCVEEDREKGKFSPHISSIDCACPSSTRWNTHGRKPPQ
jgi:poly(A)-specific ribonuclease